MHQVFLASMASGLLLFSGAAYSEKYICIPDASIGFSYGEGANKWGSSEFNSDRKYLVLPSPSDDTEFIVKEVGDDLTTSYCEDGFNEIGLLTCGGIQDFRFNRDTGRFMTIYLFGYVNVPQDAPTSQQNADTPHMQIGKCSSL